MKLFNLPSDGSLFSSALRRILNAVIGNDIFRFVGRDKDSEQFHFEIPGKPSNFDSLAGKERVVAPEERVDRTVGKLTVGVVHHPILLDRTVEDLFQRVDPQQGFGVGIPTVHKHRAKQNVSLQGGTNHVMHVIDLALPVFLGIEDAKVDDPEAIKLWVVVHTRDHSNTFDHPVDIAGILFSDPVDFEREVFIQNRIVKQ